MNIKIIESVDCLCDFTYDFFWQHKGSRLSPTGIIPNQADTGYAYSDLVECLKQGEDVFIEGNAGKRLGSSLGVDLRFFGGTGRSLKVGSIMVEGNVDTRMGISMISGAVYVKGTVKQPLGNVIEVESDRRGYHKYCSITGILQDGSKEILIPPNSIKEDTLFLRDGLIRDTIAARLDSDKRVIVEGNAGMSTGILMNRGTIIIKGDSGMNTGVLQKGGSLVVNNTEEFAGSYMKGGTLIVRGKSRGYLGANMKGGTLFFKGETMHKPVLLDGKDIKTLVRLLGISQIEAMMFKKFCTL